MIKFISSEEYAKLTGDVAYWKLRALEEHEHWQKIHENEVSDILKENKVLRLKIKELEKEKVTFISFKGIKALREAEILAEKVRKVINKEHHCDKNCFAEHVLPAIQRDYDKCNNSSHLIRHKFIEYWSNKLHNEYDFISCICLVNDKLAVKYR